MQTEIELAFADGDYLFRLPLKLLNELQQKTGLGIGALYAKLIRGRYLLRDGSNLGNPEEAAYAVADVIEPIRLGLIGGGTGMVNGETVAVDPVRARELVEAYCYPERPLAEAWTLAAAILTACVEGYEPKKKRPPMTDSPGTDGSTTDAASPIAPSPEPEPGKPENSPSTNTKPSSRAGRKLTPEATKKR